MTRFQRRIVVERPIHETFAFVSDLRNAPKWDPTVREAVKLSEGEIGLGTSFRLTSRLPGPGVGRLTLERPYEVIDFSPPTADRPGRIRMEGETRVARYVEAVTFTSCPEGTQLDYDARLGVKGILTPSRWLAWFAARWMGKRATDLQAEAILKWVPPAPAARSEGVLRQHA